MAQDLAKTLDSLFDAERQVRTHHAALAGADAGKVLDVLASALVTAQKEAEDESSLRLVRIAEILAEIDGARAVDLLVDVLGAEAPEARLAAGEALEERGYARFKELALGIERAIERLPPHGAALVELPYLLAEIPEPGVLKLLGRFLKSEEPDVVASAVEALAQTADPDGIPLLMPLVKDKRVVSMEDGEGDEATVTLGELAKEAIDLLQSASRASEGGPARGGRS